MIRWRILRTLLYKELLRYRYNWGLLMLVVALLALSALVSIAARFNKLPGQFGGALEKCHVFYPSGHWGGGWGRHLAQYPPATEHPIEFQELPPGTKRPKLPLTHLVIMLQPPKGADGNTRPAGAWKVHYRFQETALVETLPYRDWISRQTHRYLGIQPLIEEELQQLAEDGTMAIADKVPFVITALVAFGLYLLSFNLYITSTGEEREKRVLLGLLLSPAKAQEVIAAKAIFYALASLLVGLAIVAMYQPQLLANPLLWSTLLLGALGYVAIGTVVVSVVRRQTTINVVSTLYLVSTGIVILLSQFLPLFVVLRVVLMEDYLYRQLRWLLTDQGQPWALLNQAVLAIIVLIWIVVSVYIFGKRSTAIAQAR